MPNDHNINRHIKSNKRLPSLHLLAYGEPSLISLEASPKSITEAQSLIFCLFSLAQMSQVYLSNVILHHLPYSWTWLSPQPLVLQSDSWKLHPLHLAGTKSLKNILEPHTSPLPQVRPVHVIRLQANEKPNRHEIHVIPCAIDSGSLTTQRS
jgi:hypothetical protein